MTDPPPGGNLTDAAEVRLSGCALGAEVLGLDLDRALDRDLDPLDIGCLRAWWSEYLVLRLPDQSLDAARLRRVAAIFGTPREPGRRRMGGWECPGWAEAEPPAGGLIYWPGPATQAEEVEFASQTFALVTLPREERQRIAALRLCDGEGHDQPLVTVHEGSGLATLYLGDGCVPGARIEGLPPDQETALRERLWHHATAYHMGWKFMPRAGDLVIFHARATLQRGLPAAHDPRALQIWLCGGVPGLAPA